VGGSPIGDEGAKPKIAEPIAARSHHGVALEIPQAATEKPSIVRTTRIWVTVRAVPPVGFAVPANAEASHRNVVP
jgi:hypothetical protein